MELLKITGYTDEEFATPYKENPYLVMINPESIKWERNIEYNDQQSPDSSAPSLKFKSIPLSKLNFDIVIDCTGIVDSQRTDMSVEIEALEKIIYTYNGEIHRPNFVNIQWGKDITFNGCLESFNASYTLFRPDGSPIRAKISLGFASYVSPCTVKKQDNRQSPDVSHLVNVVEGNTLPQLCQKIWKDGSCYIQVARFNDLNKFRDLKSIKQLVFPPIIPAT